MTRNGKRILEIINHSDDHLTAEQIFLRLKQTYPKIALATVYNNLHSLCVPYNALGAGVILDALAANIPVYAIKENSTVLDIDKNAIKLRGVTELDTYEDYIKIVEKGNNE